MLDFKRKIRSGARFRKKGRLLYNSKDYKNPYFGQARISRPPFYGFRLALKIKLLAFAALAVILLAGWIVFYSSYFDIKKITINGLVRIDENEIKDLVWENINHKYFLFVNNQNIFQFNRQRLYGQLSDKYAFAHLKIGKKPPGELIIDCEEKDYVYIWLEESAYFYIDADGYVITGLSEEEAKNKKYPVIQNLSDYKISENRIGLDRIYLDYVSFLAKAVKEKIPDLTVNNYFIDKESYAVKISLKKGPVIITSVQEDAAKQLNKLLAIKNQRSKNDFENKSYIDIRYGDRVFIKSD